MKEMSFLRATALAAAVFSALASPPTEHRQTESATPLGPPDSQSTYRLDSDAPLRSNTVQRFDLNLGPVEESRALRRQWVAVQAAKPNGQRFAA